MSKTDDKTRSINILLVGGDTVSFKLPSTHVKEFIASFNTDSRFLAIGDWTNKSIILSVDKIVKVEITDA